MARVIEDIRVIEFSLDEREFLKNVLIQYIVAPNERQDKEMARKLVELFK